MSNKIKRNTQIENLLVKGGLYLFDPYEVKNPKARINPMDVNDQHYGICIPVYSQRDGEFYMIDTYKLNIEGGLSEVTEQAEQYFDDNNSGRKAILSASWDYEYNNSPKVTIDNINQFELVGKLADFEEVNKHTWEKYHDASKFNGFIAHEMNAPYGSYLVKKDAKVDHRNVLNQLHNSIYNDMGDKFIPVKACEDYLYALNQVKEEDLIIKDELIEYEELAIKCKELIKVENNI